MAKREKILIAGFSGAGKTSFLRKLEEHALKTEWEFADLDQLIVKNRGKGEKFLARIIERDGWEKFRLYERQELESWLKEEGAGILALGGGTLSQLLFDLYKKNPRVEFCYLEAPFEDCWERLQLAHTEPRPLVLKGKASLQQVYQEREQVFEQISWRVQNRRGTDLLKLVQEFWAKLERE